MRYENKIIVFSIILIIFSTNQAFGEDNPIIVKSHDEVSIMSYIPTTTYPIFELELRNFGNATGNIEGTYPTDLILKGESTFSILDPKIKSSMITEYENFPNTITTTNPEYMIWKINEIKTDEGTYTGKIFINGTNFKPTEIDVSISYVVSPWFILGLNFVGIGLALCIGKWLENKEQNDKKEKKISKCYDTLMHISEHILWINKERFFVSEKCWKTMWRIAEEYVDKIEEEIKNLSLNPESENVKWFEEFHKKIQEEISCNPERYQNTNAIRLPNKKILSDIINNEFNKLKSSKIDVADFDSIAEGFSTNFMENERVLEFVERNQILKKTIDQKNDTKASLILSYTDKEQEKELEKIIKKIVKDKNKSRGKMVFLGITAGFTALTSIFAIDSFVGPLWLNALFAIGLGFVVYRSQDLQKLIKKEED